MQKIHKTVLPTAAVEALALKPGAFVIDATLGSGGHSREIIKRIGCSGSLLAIDVDPDAIAVAEKEFEKLPHVSLRVGNFRTIDKYATENSVDAILADLGWRTEQFTLSGRGFSFKSDEPLLMTLGDPKEYAFTAYDIVNEWSVETLHNIIRGYGEERFVKRIVDAIDAARKVKPIESAKELGDIIMKAVPSFARHGRIHPATKTFQALRVAVNDELGALDDFITNSWKILKSGGRLAVISFHSLEDRIIKHRFKDFATARLGELPYRKPHLPSSEECEQNPRARSAKLRTIIKT